MTLKIILIINDDYAKNVQQLLLLIKLDHYQLQKIANSSYLQGSRDISSIN